MKQEVDNQTRMIVDYLTEHNPRYVLQIKWISNPLMRVIDLFAFGAIGRLFLSVGRNASGSRAITSLSEAIAMTFSKKVMAKALFYRANHLFEGATEADSSIADYSLAIWCDPADCWARKNRATIYEMYQASYDRGDEEFSLPMTHAGATADAAAAADYFRELASTHPLPEGRDDAKCRLEQCEELIHKLRVRKLSN